MKPNLALVCLCWMLAATVGWSQDRVCGSAWESPLVTEKGAEVGTVVIWNDETDLYVEYKVNDGWVLWDTDLMVTKKLGDFYEKPKSGAVRNWFPLRCKHHRLRKHTEVKKLYSYNLVENAFNEGETLYIAAHADIRKVREGKGVLSWLPMGVQDAWAVGKMFSKKCEGMYIERTVQACATLPTEPLGMVVIPSGSMGSFVQAQLSGIPANYDFKNGTFRAWYMDSERHIDANAFYQVKLYSTYDVDLPTHMLRRHWDKVNYILNHKQGSVEEVQQAIWYFVGGIDFPEDEAAARVVSEAQQRGAGFVPGTDQVLAVLADAGPQLQVVIVELGGK